MKIGRPEKLGTLATSNSKYLISSVITPPCPDPLHQPAGRPRDLQGLVRGHLHPRPAQDPQDQGLGREGPQWAQREVARVQGDHDDHCPPYRMSYGGLLGFKAGFFLSMVDIFLIKQIKERKAQIARCAFFTVPITTMGAGWMGGVEFAKICFGRWECAVQCCAVLCCAVQCSAVQCSAVQCSAVQCSAVQCSAVQCSTVQCSAVQCSAVECNMVTLQGQRVCLVCWSWSARRNHGHLDQV